MALRAQQIVSAEHDDAAQCDEGDRVLAEIEKGGGGPRGQTKGGNAFHAGTALLENNCDLRVFPVYHS
ncbi:hypothetical protein PSAB6_10386 [Paraburkholderia sabiae]|nr:hypothetical protein PSAB6_10386 [Paraburkholderia sabiae]